MTTVNLTKTAIFSVPPETVWQFLTQKDKLGSWFHPADADLAQGKDFALLDKNNEPLCWGNVQKMQAPTLLVYTFTVKPMQGAMTTVHWQLDAVDSGTRLVLTHEGLDTSNPGALGLIQALDAGWDEHFSVLRKVSS